jgi:hypothetical protein
VLKPGGSLVLSDLLVRPPLPGLPDVVPPANYLDTIDGYKEVWRQAGFPEVTIVDATAEVWHAFCQHLSRWAEHKRLDRMDALRLSLFLKHYNIDLYLLASARKP